MLRVHADARVFASSGEQIIWHSHLALDECIPPAPDVRLFVSFFSLKGRIWANFKPPQYSYLANEVSCVALAEYVGR